MITIFSIEFDDSTNQVIDWLDYYSATWKRINSEDIENEIEIIVKTHDSNQLDKKNTVWFRKWRKTTDEINHETKDVYIELNKGIEFEQFSNYLFHCHSNGYWLNHPNNLAYDKITQLNRAKTIGIEIPPTLFTNSKTELLEFIKKYTAIITKPLNASILVQSRGKNLINYTRIVDKQEINQLEEYFYPSLFQKFIDKEFEIRSFYLEGNFYSMAIFSQNDERTKIDFRH
ncbi:MAG TPA: hypothetical protein DEQ03_12605, partial [Marinilabiliales bacterium]|nr:hypothetical protein [Marinilabiliales bacterium]